MSFTFERPAARAILLDEILQMAAEVPPEATAYRNAGQARPAATPIDDYVKCECGDTWRNHSHSGHRYSLVAGSRCQGFKRKEES